MLSDSVQWTLIHAEPNGWEAQWAKLQRRIARLQRLYDGSETGGSLDVEDAANDLCETADQLRNTATLIDGQRAVVTPETLDPFASYPEAASIVADVNNTNKHPRKAAGRIARVSGGSAPGFRVYLVRGDVRGDAVQGAETHDVLEVALGLRDAWRAWFADRGMDPDEWTPLP